MVCVRSSMIEHRFSFFLTVNDHDSADNTKYTEMFGKQVCLVASICY